MFENIDFGKGISKKYIDFDIDQDVPLENQIDILKEDLLQVCYDNNYLIDMGWYPEFAEEGFFKISVIKDYQWDIPVLQKNCRDLNLLDKYVHDCINFIQTKRSNEY